MAPGNRQAVIRWVREVLKPSPEPLSPYLQKAAVYSDSTGSEIIMAMDLDGVMSFERVGKYMKAHEKQFNEWQAGTAKPMKLSEAASMLSSIEGIRIGVRIGEKQSSKIAVDFHSDVVRAEPFAKQLMLQFLADKGAMIDELKAWNAKAQRNEISFSGLLSADGRRRLLSLINSPVSESSVTKATPVSPGENLASTKETMAKKSRDYFRAIVGMANDLKMDMRDATSLAATQLYFDKYAKRIERMPILGVDEELLDYSAFVADSLRQATGSVKTMGIQSGARSAQVLTSDVYDGGGYDYYG